MSSVALAEPMQLLAGVGVASSFFQLLSSWQISAVDNGRVHNPLWMLAPWALVAAGAGALFWPLTAAFRRRGQASSAPTERDRRMLEQIWGWR